MKANPVGPMSDKLQMDYYFLFDVDFDEFNA